MVLLVAVSLPGVTTQTVYVSSSSGVDDGACGAVSAPCRTIAHGVDRACLLASFASVSVAAGPYTASSCGIIPSCDVSISGQGVSETVVDCELTDSFLRTNYSVAVSRLTVTRGQALTNLSGSASFIEAQWSAGSRAITLTELAFTDGGSVASAAVSVSSADDATSVTVSVTDCIFDHASTGSGTYPDATCCMILRLSPWSSCACASRPLCHVGS